MLDYTKFKEKAEILKTLGHPLRLCIVAGLLDKECNVAKMQECLGLPQPIVSQHLAVLKKKGLVKGERQGTKVVYRIDNETVRALVDILFEEKRG